MMTQHQCVTFRYVVFQNNSATKNSNVMKMSTHHSLTLQVTMFITSLEYKQFAFCYVVLYFGFQIYIDVITVRFDLNFGAMKLQWTRSNSVPKYAILWCFCCKLVIIRQFTQTKWKNYSRLSLWYHIDIFVGIGWTLHPMQPGHIHAFYQRHVHPLSYVSVNMYHDILSIFVVWIKFYWCVISPSHFD